jgi:high-affinity iron transporter
MQIFLVVSTCLLYLVGAGLFSRSVWYFEMAAWNKYIGGEAEEFGDGPGSYDIDQSVWHVNVSAGSAPSLKQQLTHVQCCSPQTDGGWGIFNAIFGWTNSATYGSVISYNLYWVFVIVMFILMRYREVKGHWPGTKPKAASPHHAGSISEHSGSDMAGAVNHKVATKEQTVTKA